MRGLDPRIHRKNNFYSKVMDCRVKPVKPGNDAGWVNVHEAWYESSQGGQRRIASCALSTITLLAFAHPSVGTRPRSDAHR